MTTPRLVAALAALALAACMPAQTPPRSGVLNGTSENPQPSPQAAGDTTRVPATDSTRRPPPPLGR